MHMANLAPSLTVMPGQNFLASAMQTSSPALFPSFIFFSEYSLQAGVRSERCSFMHEANSGVPGHLPGQYFLTASMHGLFWRRSARAASPAFCWRWPMQAAEASVECAFMQSLNPGVPIGASGQSLAICCFMQLSPMAGACADAGAVSAARAADRMW